MGLLERDQRAIRRWRMPPLHERLYRSRPDGVLLDNVPTPGEPAASAKKVGDGAARRLVYMREEELLAWIQALWQLRMRMRVRVCVWARARRQHARCGRLERR